MTTRVTYELDGAVATIRLDDGKANALSREALGEIDAALSRAEADRAAVLFTGREGTFSAGFDLRVLGSGGKDAYDMLLAGFELAHRIFTFSAPVVIACSGHAVAMGAFLLVSADYRVGASGAFKIGANEVKIGLTMPFFATEICRQRLSPAHFYRSVALAEIHAPEDAVSAGFLDRVVPAPELASVARAKAEELAKLDRNAYQGSKLRARAPATEAMRAALELDRKALNALL